LEELHAVKKAVNKPVEEFKWASAGKPVALKNVGGILLNRDATSN